MNAYILSISNIHNVHGMMMSSVGDVLFTRSEKDDKYLFPRFYFSFWSNRPQDFFFTLHCLTEIQNFNFRTILKNVDDLLIRNIVNVTVKP